MTQVRLVLACLLATTIAQGALAGKPAKKLLVVSHTAGFRHTEGIDAGHIALKEIGEVSKVFTVQTCRDAEEVKTMLTPQYLTKNGFDGVVFLNTTGDLGIPDLTAFLDWIKAGKAFIGMHAATDTYNRNTVYTDFIGDVFTTHGAQCTIQPIVDDKKHPATAGWDAGTRIREEVYEFQRNDRSKVRVLLSLDRHPDDGHPNAGQPEDCLIAWVRPHGKGRVFYTSFGHRADVWTNEAVRQHMLGGIRWALGLARGDAKPVAKAPK